MVVYYAQFIISFFSALINAHNNTAVGNDKELCGCKTVRLVTTNSLVLGKNPIALGSYQFIEQEINSFPAYEHETRPLFLSYYNTIGQSGWSVGGTLNTTLAEAVNEGDAFCPYLLASMWAFFDEESESHEFDPQMKLICESNQCSKLRCGHNSLCQKSFENDFECQCLQGYEGNPLER